MSAFGYVTAQVPVTLTADEITDVVVTLELADVGHVSGVVTSRGDIGTGAGPAAEGQPIAGATVELAGYPGTPSPPTTGTTRWPTSSPARTSSWCPGRGTFASPSTTSS